MNKKNTKESESVQINEKDFILNFLQKKKDAAGLTVEPGSRDILPKSVNDNLADQGLSPWFDTKNERRQRAVLWLMMDQDGDG